MIILVFRDFIVQNKPISVSCYLVSMITCELFLKCIGNENFYKNYVKNVPVFHCVSSFSRYFSQLDIHVMVSTSQNA